jgi:hypothetical protein
LTFITCSGVPFGDQLAAPVAALGSQVDQPVGDLDDVEVVLDDQDRVAGIHQALQHFDQLVDVGGVQAHRRLIQHIQRPPGGAAGELLRELDALGFAARERGGGCPTRM